MLFRTLRYNCLVGNQGNHISLVILPVDMYVYNSWAIDVIKNCLPDEIIVEIKAELNFGSADYPDSKCYMIDTTVLSAMIPQIEEILTIVNSSPTILHVVDRDNDYRIGELVPCEIAEIDFDKSFKNIRILELMKEVLRR